MRPAHALTLLFITGCSPSGESSFDNCPEGMSDNGSGKCVVDTDDNSGTDAGSDADTGTPLATDVTGETYAVDLSTATWEEPAGIGAFLGGTLDAKILIGVEDASDTIDFLLAIPDGDSLDQDYCIPTIDFEPISFASSPFFEIGPVDLPINLLSYSLTIYGMNIDGTFQADGSGMNNISISGALDLRDLEDALGGLSGGVVSNAEGACDLIEILGVSCTSCPSDDEELCLSVSLTDVEATATGTELEVVEEGVVHPECEE
jgi:hypothetical protein